MDTTGQTAGTHTAGPGTSTGPPAQGDGANRLRAAWREGLATALGVYALSRVLVLGVAFAATRGSPRGLLGGLSQWDGAWYASIVAAWYPGDVARIGGDAIRANLAFFPAFPLLSRLVDALPGVSPEGAAVVVAHLTGAAATAAVWWFARRRDGTGAAARAAVLFAVLPASVILSMAYAEALMIAASAVALTALLERRWWLAGVAGAVATASRPTAAVLVACAALAAVLAWRRDGDRQALVAPLLSAAGVVGSLAYAGLRTGEPLAWLTVQREGWGERVDFGEATVAGLWRAVAAPNAVDIVDLLAFAFLVVALVLLVRERPPAIVLLFVVGVLASPLLSYTLGPRPRFVYVAFPLVAVVAARLRGAWWWLVVGASIAGLCVLTWLYTGTWAVTP